MVLVVTACCPSMQYSISEDTGDDWSAQSKNNFHLRQIWEKIVYGNSYFTTQRKDLKATRTSMVK